MLTRRDFEGAAANLLARCREYDDASRSRYSLSGFLLDSQEWQWSLSAVTKWTPSIGYLARREPLDRFYAPAEPSGQIAAADDDQSDEMFDTATTGGVAVEHADDDDAALLLVQPRDGPTMLPCRVRLSICYSPSYGVPVLWIDAYNSNGAPLNHAELVRSTLFHHDAMTAASAHSAQAYPDHPSRPPVIVSQADHPVTGLASWFVHPCETETIVREVLEACPAPAMHEGIELVANIPVRWLETWLMVISSLVDMRP